MKCIGLKKIIARSVYTLMKIILNVLRIKYIKSALRMMREQLKILSRDIM
jgi:hypothetical protein